jgi:hypothetical protein
MLRKTTLLIGALTTEVLGYSITDLQQSATKIETTVTSLE